MPKNLEITNPPYLVLEGIRNTPQSTTDAVIPRRTGGQRVKCRGTLVQYCQRDVDRGLLLFEHRRYKEEQYYIPGRRKYRRLGISPVPFVRVCSWDALRVGLRMAVFKGWMRVHKTHARYKKDDNNHRNKDLPLLGRQSKS